MHRTMPPSLVSIPFGEDTLSASLATPPGAARGTLVLLHGFLSSRLEFADASERLAAKGWRVLALDFRGHGGSTGARGRTDLVTMAADARRARAWLAERGFPGPFAVVGHSTGCPIALAALADDDGFAAGAIVAPLRTLKHEMNAFERVATPVLDKVSKGFVRFGMPAVQFPYRYAKAYQLLYDDPEAAKRARASAFLQPKASLAFYDEAMAVDGEREARRVTKPVLVVVAANDKVVKRENAMAVHDALAGPKELATLPSGHSAFGDRSAGELVERLDAWFAKTLGVPGKS